MIYFVTKVLVTAVLVGVISEVGKRSTFWGSVLASLPVTALLAMLWLYRDTKDAHRLGQFSMDIFWLVWPSQVLFLALPLLIKAGWGFFPSLLTAMALTVVAYFGMTYFLKG